MQVRFPEVMNTMWLACLRPVVTQANKYMFVNTTSCLAVLGWAVLGCAVLCCAVLCCAVLCCAVLRCAALRCAVLYCAALLPTDL